MGEDGKTEDRLCGGNLQPCRARVPEFMDWQILWLAMGKSCLSTRQDTSLVLQKCTLGSQSKKNIPKREAHSQKRAAALCFVSGVCVCVCIYI